MSSRKTAKIREVEATNGGKAPHLADVTRQILEEFKSEQHIESDLELARRIGVPKSSVQRLMAPEPGGTIETLSKVIAGLREDAVTFLERHPLYGDPALAEEKPGHLKHRLADQLATVLTFEEVYRLLDLVDTQKKLQLFEISLEIQERLIRAAKIQRQA